jgi:hypothetical protein
VPDRDHAELLEALLTEMLQTEQSALEHARKEASRLQPDAGPAQALRAVSDHAAHALRELERLADRRERGVGRTIGSSFSAIRDRVLDRLVSREKSYRGTLLGLHHGIDCAVLTQAVAQACGRSDVAAFLTGWLEERRDLVHACQRQLAWFASHPTLAMDRAS